MEKENYLPYDISEDGKFGKYKTDWPEGLPQEVVVYFPNGYNPEPKPQEDNIIEQNESA